MNITRKTDSAKTNTGLTGLPGQVVAIARRALEDKKAEDINIIPLTGSSSWADAFIIATGTSERHVHTLAEQVVAQLEDAGVEVLGMEGTPSNHWIVVDAGDVIVHIFLPETRALYNLDKLWGHSFDDDNPGGDDDLLGCKTG